MLRMPQPLKDDEMQRRAAQTSKQNVQRTAHGTNLPVGARLLLWEARGENVFSTTNSLARLQIARGTHRPRLAERDDY
jgi:hypothetical protein